MKNKKIDIDRIKDIVNELRNYKLTEDDKPYFNKVFVSTWFRESDYLSNYKELYKLEEELSDEVKRFEYIHMNGEKLYKNGELLKSF